jgi:endonuclease III
VPRESKAAKWERMQEVLRRLEDMYPDSRCSLDHDDPLQLLVATVLSAQCTDARVNQVTPALFRKYPAAADYGAASQEEMEADLASVNFFRNKAKALRGMGEALDREHGGEVPAELEPLTALPGVGRKTANVVLGVGFGVADGVVVDTHVKRIARRLGFTRHADPEKVEKDLLPLIPEENRVVFTHRMIDHGRAVCVARKPRCEICDLSDICPSSHV